MTKEEWTSIKAGLLKDEEKAFEKVYNHLWEKLYTVALRYLQDQASAQEIVQDVFVAFWVKRKRLQTVDDIGAFAMQSIKNRIYDHFDKKAVEHRYALKVSETPVRNLNTTQHQVEYDETFGLIDREINKLPDTTQEIFRLSRFDKYSNEEIASRLQLSVKSVEYHVTQALKKLRVRLKYTGTILVLLSFFKVW